MGIENPNVLNFSEHIYYSSTSDTRACFQPLMARP
jgi:hypothetical protein